MGEGRTWGAPRGNQGSITDPVTELGKQSRADSERRRLERQDSIDELKSEAEKKELEKKLSGEETQKMEKLAEAVSKTKEELAAERQRALEKKMEDYQGQILQLVQGDPKVKELENKLTEARAERDQERLNELKNEIAKLREEGSRDITKELEKIEPLMEKLGYKKEPSSSEMPPDIWLRIRQLELDQERERLKAESEREDRKDARELTKLQWTEEKEMKSAQAHAEIAAKKEGNQLLADVVEKLAHIITAAAGGAVAGAGAGAITSQVIEAGVGEAGETECPGCHTVIPIQEADTSTVCAGCGTNYTIKRTAKAPEASEVG